MDEPTFVAIVGCLIVVVLMLMRVPIAISLGSVAVVGFGYMVDFDAAMGILIDSPIRTVTNFNFSVIPMFILMGVLVSAGGMSRELFRRPTPGSDTCRAAWRWRRSWHAAALPRSTARPSRQRRP